MSTKRWRLLPTALTMLVGMASPLAAQNSNIAPSTPAPDATNVATGWVLTPSVAVSSAWDDNVFVQGEGDAATGDVINSVSPRLATTFTGRRTLLSVNYSGAFLLYRDLGDLNSYDQRATISARQRLSKRATFFVENSFAAVPTTELSALVDVPFVRTGSKLDDFRAGIEAALSKRTTLAFAGDFQWVAFDQNPAFVAQLHGGHGFGGEASLRHKISARTAFIADYRLQHAFISQTTETFDVQTAGGGFEHQFSEFVTAYGELGIARLVATVLGESRTGPSIRAGLSRRAPRSDFEVAYSRMFVPSYGFGGTTQNEEASASLNVPFSRRWYGHVAAAVRRNEPLTIGIPNLRSVWIEGSFGYDLSTVAQIEVFYGTAHQVIDRPGGVVDRSRVGVQVVTAKRMRIH